MDQPEPFKHYLELPPIPLPKRSPNTGFPVSSALVGQLGELRELDAAELARILMLAAGVKSVRAQPSGTPVYLRNYACAGALYPIEVYPACVRGLRRSTTAFTTTAPWTTPCDSSGQATPARTSSGPADSAQPWPGPADRDPHRHPLAHELEVPGPRLPPPVLGLGNDRRQPAGPRRLRRPQLRGRRWVRRFASWTPRRVDGRTEMSLCMVPIGFDRPVPGAALQRRRPRSGDTSRGGQALLSHTGVRRGDGSPPADRPAQPGRSPVLAAGPLPEQRSASRAHALTGIEKTIRKRGSKRAFSWTLDSKEDLEGIISSSTYSLACDWGQDLTQMGVVAERGRRG